MEKGLSGDFPPELLLGNWKWLWHFNMETHLLRPVIATKYGKKWGDGY